MQKNQEKHLFERLSEEKRERIIHACIDEFAHSGFNDASTNRIAKAAGIAKGSLFKYFGTKEHMYYHMAEHVLIEYLEYFKQSKPKMPKDLVDRFMEMQHGIYDYFKNNRNTFRLFKQMQSSQGIIQDALREKWMQLAGPMVDLFFEGADLSRLAITPEELINIMRWLDVGVDSSIMQEISEDTTPEDFMKIYEKKMALIYKVLKSGIYKKEKK